MHVAIDPGQLDPRDRHKLTIGSVVPRPIAWTTSVSVGGSVNLAPFSYFMACHSYVPAIAVSIGSRGGTPKDTRANVEATGELVVNIVTEDLVEVMNRTAASFPSEIDELATVGLTPLPSTVVRPPRVAESPIHLECRVLHTLVLGEPPLESTLFVAGVVMWHIDERVLMDGYKIDQAALRAVGRMGGIQYTRTREPFALRIPDWRDVPGPGHGESTGSQLDDSRGSG